MTRLSIDALARRYTAGECSPAQVLADARQRAEALPDRNIWITLAGPEQLQRQCEALEARKRQGAVLPLYGIPFAAKDNIDAAGFDTSAGCPSYAYRPRADAPVVQRLREAGALLLGKTNMDQFATGLVGTRSPHGACVSQVSGAHVAGGSSSGSALAVAHGLCAFSLGTDTAGSGRVPAAFNELVGLKPSRGLVSTRGLVPACRSLDCVSVFADCIDDAQRVLDVVAHFDPEEPYSRDLWPLELPDAPRVGVPTADALEFFGDGASEALFAAAVERLRQRGVEVVEIDLSPFAAAARLLYEGSWVAERYAAVGPFLETDPPDADPTVKAIVLGGKRPTASDAFADLHALQALRRAASQQWAHMDVMLLPTTPTIYTPAEVAAAPVETNSRLGTYTNFVNLLDLCAVALPAGRRPDGAPFGITLMSPAGADSDLLRLAAGFGFQAAGSRFSASPADGP